MRILDERIEDIEVIAERLRDPSEEDRRKRLEERIAKLNADKEILAATIPAEWADTYATFDKLNDAETDLRRKYNQAANKAYEPAATLLASLNAYEAFQALGDDLASISDAVVANEPAEMAEPLNVLSKKFGAIEGADDIKSALSKARRALRSKTPDKDKVLGEIDKVLEAYAKQSEWRKAADSSLKSGVGQYIQAMAPTIGIRAQNKLTRDQALYVAACSSDHRDISLNF